MIAAPGRPAVLPVIHYADDAQAMRNAERAIEAGCAGVMLIDMGLGNDGLIFPAAAIKRRWPDHHVGVNHLRCDIERAVKINLGVVDSTWGDEQLTHSSDSDYRAYQLARSLADGPPHTIFCAVAFKYQRPDPDPAQAARIATALGFIPTTSGPATGEAANLGAVERLSRTIGPESPLAIASGITPENAPAFAPLVSHILVSTGVSASFHEFDPARLKALIEAVRP